MARSLARVLPLVFLTSQALGQARTDAGVNAQGPTVASLCASHATSLPSGAPGGFDTTVSPAVVTTSAGALVVYRTAAGALRIASLQRSLARGSIDRELARAGGPFAMVATADGGAMVAMLVRAHVAGAEDSVLLAHVSATGEALNVPREVGRALHVDGVSIDAVRSGFAVVWGVVSDATFAVLTDARGVPLVAVRRVLERVSMPVVVADPGEPGIARVRAQRGVGNGTETIVLGADGAPGEPVTWYDGVGLATGVGSERTVLGLAEDHGTDTTSGSVLEAREQGSGTLVSPLVPRLPHPSTVMAVRGITDGLVALLDEPSGRESLFRVGADATTALLAVRDGSHGAVAVQSDTAFVIAGFDPAASARGEMTVVSVTCPRRTPAEATPGG